MKKKSLAPILLIVAGAGLAAAIVVVALVVTRSKAEPMPEAPALSLPTDPAKREPPKTSIPGLDEEALARELYDQAERFSKENADKADVALGKFRDVSATYPLTSWAAKARDRAAALEDELGTLFEREFESLRQAAGSKAKEGDIVGALTAIDAYLAGNPKDILCRRAAIERVVIENAARDRFNAAVNQAGSLAKQQKHDEAIALFETMKKGAMADVASACGEEIEKLKAAKVAFAASLMDNNAAAAEEKFRAEAAKIVPLARSRKFDDAIAAIPAAVDPLKALVDRERSALKAAAQFAAAIEAGARSRIGQEVVVRTADKPAKGTLTKATATSVTVEEREVAYADMADDQLIVFAFAKGGLSAAAADSYVKAAMYFFYTGKDALARLELANAKELGAEIADFEAVWRSGLTRTAR